MKFRILLATAAVALLSTTGAFAADYLGGAVKSSDIAGKMVLTDANGMTLYTWDKDEMGAKSNCYEQCAVNWPI
jgi:predicted lipoprotein with Yx(FWY)xxD motif